MKPKNQDDSWIICPECKTKLKHENLSDHMEHVHNKKIENFDESSIKVLPKKEQKKKKSMNLSIGAIAVILVILAVIIGVAYFVLSGSSDDSNKPGWLDDYTPVYSVGIGSNDFWINYPPGSTSSGEEVDHLSWIVNDLKTKPVLFVVHRTGCQPCTPQAERVIALAEKYEGYVKLYDLDITGASADTTNKINDVFMYDVTGSSAIAFTGAYTYVKENGTIKTGWHTWVGNVVDAEMENWIKDAIYYYQLNKGE